MNAHAGMSVMSDCIICLKTYSLVRIFYTVAFVYCFFVCLLVGYTAVTPNAFASTATQHTITGILDTTKTTSNQLKFAKSGGKSPQIRNVIPNWDNITTVPLYSDSVINPHLFNFTITNRDVCFMSNNTAEKIFLVILVKCRPNETYDRQQIRRTWGGVTKVLGRRTITMFLVGQTRNETANQRLRIEDNGHHDFIQEDFIDAYLNMTYKNIMGLKWVTLFCPHVSYVLSIDSDMTLNIYNLVLRLIAMPRERFAEGNLRVDPLPHRHKSSKWYTPYEMYPEPTYAPFLNGACYAMSGDVAAAVFRGSVHVRFLQWDDVFVGLVMRKVGVEPRLSSLYEQFLATRFALKHGIGKGIRHNINNVNKHAIKIWDDLVGKYLRDKKTMSPFIWTLLVCNFCFVLALLLGCSINFFILSEPAKSESFRV